MWCSNLTTSIVNTNRKSRCKFGVRELSAIPILGSTSKTKPPSTVKANNGG
jgi:hypothetical protein